MGEEKPITIALSGTIGTGIITNIISPPIEFEHTAELLEVYLVPSPLDANDYRVFVTPFWATGMTPGVGGSFIPEVAEPLLPPPNIVNGQVNQRYGAIIVPKYFKVSVIPINTPVERYTQYGLNVLNPSPNDILLQALLYLKPLKGDA
jgi:hypothetical protein